MIFVSEFFEPYRILEQPAHERHDPRIIENAIQRLQHLGIRLISLELDATTQKYAAQQQAEQRQKRYADVRHFKNRFHVGIFRFFPAHSMEFLRFHHFQRRYHQVLQHTRDLTHHQHDNRGIRSWILPNSLNSRDSDVNNG